MFSDKVQYRYNQIRSTRDVKGSAGWSGSVDFETTVPINERVDLMSSYLNIIADLTKPGDDWAFDGFGIPVDTAGLTVTSPKDKRDGLCQNVFAAMIRTATLYVNDKEVARSDDYGIASTQMKLTFNTVDEEIDSMSAVVPYDHNVAGNYDDLNILTNSVPIVKVGVRGAVNGKVDSHFKRIYRASPQQDSNATGSSGSATVIRVHLALPLSPLFIQQSFDEALPQCKVRLQLVADPDHLTKMIVTEANAITMNIVDMFWNVPSYQNPQGIPAGISYSTKFIECHTTRRVSAGGSIQVNTPSPGIHTVLVSFGPSANDLPTDFHQFSGPFLGTYNTPNLTSLYVNYGSRSYPSPQYDFTGMKDASRAYFDYRVYSLAHSTSSGSVMTFRQWCESPVFVFSVTGEYGSQSNMLTVNVTGVGTIVTSAYNVYITTLHDKQLTIDYNENGQVEKTEVASVV